jgi:hypothetical protein
MLRTASCITSQSPNLMPPLPRPITAPVLPPQALPLEEVVAPGQDLAPPEEEGPSGAGHPGSKRAVHGDMAAVVICLQWPRWVVQGGRGGVATQHHRWAGGI